jgi:ribonuclease HII
MSEQLAEKFFTTGLDEAGRGALAGPVVAAVVCWPDGLILPGLNDSKKLTALQRERLFDKIIASACAWHYVALSPVMIDEMNILQASLEAMRLSLQALPQQYQAHAIADGPFQPASHIQALINGDSLVPAISAASVVAKVMRDRMMQSYHLLYPQYGFNQHKGYPTAQHQQRLKQYGVSPLHRLSYSPVAACL